MASIGSVTASFCGIPIAALWATYNERKSYQRLYVSGSSESMCAPLVNVNHFLFVPVKCETNAGQCPPVCSSSNWHAMNVGTLILCTNVTGSSASAIDGL